VLWRWAAAILLMGALVSIIYWSQSREEGQPVLAKKNLHAKPGIEKEKSNAVTETKKAVSKVHDAERVVHEDNNSQAEKSVNKKEVPIKDEKPSNAKEKLLETETGLAQQYTVKVSPTELSEEKIKTEATPKAEVASTKQKPIKLEFTLEALPSEERVATTTEVKSSGIKKVLQLARDMKQGEGPVSGLRDKKDELLAHNFITGKERNQ